MSSSSPSTLCSRTLTDVLPPPCSTSDGSLPSNREVYTRSPSAPSAAYRAASSSFHRFRIHHPPVPTSPCERAAKEPYMTQILMIAHRNNTEAFPFSAVCFSWIAQLGRAPVSKTVGCRLDSYPTCHNRPGYAAAFGTYIESRFFGPVSRLQF